MKTKDLVQPSGAKKYPNCALRGKSTGLGKIKVVDLLVILSYGPQPNKEGGTHNIPLAEGRGRAVALSLGPKIS